ncbi:MAG: hypothetical protein JNL52_03350 [Flavobacteriales bacterium]|nr:hypothetical protein [Flavobacteriales bacterium]
MKHRTDRLGRVLYGVMNRVILVIFVLCPVFLKAQLSQGGLPPGWGMPEAVRAEVPVISLPQMEEQPNDTTTIGFRYGTQRMVAVDVVREGALTILDDGRRMAQVMVHSPGAAMLSVQFDQWELPNGAEVFLYDAARTRSIGAFTAANRQPDGTMATELVPGDSVVIEYVLPSLVRAGELRVASVTHAFFDPFARASAAEERDFDPGYQSSPCHIGVNCPEAAAWQQQKRAVAMFLRPDGGGCTGTLLNNTQTPGRPYFHVANHCYQPNTSGWVFYFNYESTTCSGTTGNTSQTLTGAALRAAFYFDDLCLVELNSIPPASYNVYYAGWDRSGAVPQTSVVIQHPLYDVKKISFNNDPSTSFTDAIGVQCWRGNWDLGLVQAVSSGGPLFDQNGRMVGHMYDGAQVCSTATSIPTDCAKFSASWDGASASQRLRDWLDPTNTVQQLNGYDPNAVPVNLQLRLKAFLEGPYNTASGTMSTALRTAGLIPLTEPYTAAGYPHVGGSGATTTQAVLNVTGVNAIVDWVVVELRSRLDTSLVWATRSALLQADGDVVGTDGTSPVVFSLPADQYLVALRHRNHLGVLTANAVALSSTVTTLDLTNGSIALRGGAQATKLSGAVRLLFAGDVVPDGVLRYTGSNNDRDPILARVGGVTPTATIAGYFPEDVNLDGVVRYTGVNNDRDVILTNVGGVIPTSSRVDFIP